MTAAELLIVTTIVGGLAVPAIRAAAAQADRSRVTLAQGSVLNAYRIARSAAQALGRPAHLMITEDSIVIRSAGETDTTLVLRMPGPALGGVALSPTSQISVLGPSGTLVGAANVTHRLTRGGINRQVVVSRLGRVRVQ